MGLSNSNSHQESIISPPVTCRVACDVAFQICVGWLLLALAWQFLGQEPTTVSEFALRLSAMGLGYCAVLVLWISGSSWSKTIKFIGVASGLLLAVFVGLYWKWDFDSSIRVLNRATIKSNRVVHDGLGLSYALPAGANAILQPLLNQSADGSTSRVLPKRLRYGQVVIVSRIALTPRSPAAPGQFAKILCEVKRHRALDLSSFVGQIRDQENALSRQPNSRIVRPTFHHRRAGIDFVEFELTFEQPHALVRHAYLQHRSFLLHFIFDSDYDEDRSLFDGFLDSVQLRAAIPVSGGRLR